MFLYCVLRGTFTFKRTLLPRLFDEFDSFLSEHFRSCMSLHEGSYAVSLFHYIN